MAWLPGLSEEIENDPVPLASAFCARTVLPSRRVTIPVGVPPVPVTVAVIVTVCPNGAGFGDAVTLVVDAAAWTFWTSRALPLVWVLSPLYVAVIKCWSALRDDGVNVALPPFS